MWQRAYGFFINVCRTTQRNLSLFHQIFFSIPALLWDIEDIHMCSWEMLKSKEDNHNGRKLPFSESVFTFKIFLILKILPIHNWSKNALRSSDTVRGVLENCVIKIVNFCRTEAGLTSKWGRILLSVYWWYQNQPSYTVGRRATSRDVAKCFWKIGWLHTHTQTHNTTYWGSTLPNKDCSQYLTQPDLVHLLISWYNFLWVELTFVS